MPIFSAPVGRKAALALVVAALPFVWAEVHAARWQTVAGSRGETIAIDKDRVARTREGTTAWSRVQLDRPVQEGSASYDIIEAQNLYDCEGRRFTTLRRAYYLGETRIREEEASRQRSNAVLPGSIDERLLGEACKPRTVGEAKDIAAAASRAAAEGRYETGAMTADMRSAAPVDTLRPRAVAVADSKPAAAPAPSSQQAADKPRMIELPKIDKEAAAQAAAQAGAALQKPGTTSPATSSAPLAPQAPAAKTAEPKVVPRAVERAATAPVADRRALELQYATSGPRKSVSKRKADDHAANPAAQMHAHWAYEGEGAPANWGKLKPEYAVCASGKRQSPIDIREGIKVDLEAIKFDYKLSHFTVVDNGHTVQVNVGEGSSLQVMGKRYDLVQFHFHRPSEERINGRAYDMVAHLVHKDEEGRLAVVAILLERGLEHPQIQTVWNHMPLEQKQEMVSQVPLDLAKLLPDKRAYWTYMGSLTTPPCTENVLWMVFKQPVQVSPEQVAIFARLYKHNARPVQAANGRLVKESR